jgi:hypothetical protein
MKYLYLFAFSFAVLAIAVTPAHAQSSGFRRPAAGFVFSGSARSVRPLLGVPGSTYIGPPVLSDVDSASIAPGAPWAIAIRSGAATAVHGLSATSSESTIDGLALATIDRVAWSRDGHFALLSSSSRNQVQRVRFSESGAQADAPADLPAGNISALAIDTTGARMAVGVAGAGLYLVTPDQSPVLLAHTANAAAAAFSDAGRLFAIDAEARRVWEFDGDAGPSEFARLDQPDGASLDAGGLAVSGGGRYLLMTDKSVRAVRVYEIASRTLVNTIPLDFTPTRMERLSAEPVFLLNGENSGEWLLVLDARETPRVYFIPAGREEAL